MPEGVARISGEALMALPPSSYEGPQDSQQALFVGPPASGHSCPDDDAASPTQARTEAEKVITTLPGADLSVGTSL